ncbi:ricin-type beta-trefoil lectin domain protein [Streptomyces sp. S.PNR 29]|uniref:RICIN domain-containing protein n=1 Tax=Streptomyces sp. S.PNR 29 TaxID=2973805 RepID=UPI0025AF2EB5|nr:ricin-type beta-trefoil lectin domain protein [Streptomyces sp. S.PNR 29]MDN0194116.1 ricin-type beta-trefoil lectin domain protein [Streptomyces sp. S.PNR 29]
MSPSQDHGGGVSGNTFHDSAAAQSGDQGIQINQFAGAPRETRSRVRVYLAAIVVAVGIGCAGTALTLAGGTGRDAAPDRPGPSANGPSDAGPGPARPSASPAPGTPDGPKAGPAFPPRATEPTRAPHGPGAGPPDEPAPSDTDTDTSDGDGDGDGDGGKQPSPTDRQPAAARRLHNQATGMCLAVPRSDTADEAEMIQWPCSNSESQLWTLQAVSGGHRVRNAATDKCLVVSGTLGDTVTQKTCGSGADQVWVRDSLERLKNRNSGLCLAIPRSSRQQGTEAIQWTCSESTDQRWGW